MVVYPGDPPPRISSVLSIERDGCATSLLEISTHCGTHVDAPCHVQSRRGTVDEMPLSKLAGDAVVIEARGEVIRRDHLDGVVVHDKCVLFKTATARLPAGGAPEATAIGQDCAELLVASRARLVGIDRLSVDGVGDDELPVHRTLTAAGIPILEGLDLSEADPGEDYFLVAFPLRIQGGDGSPVRAALLKR